MNRFADLLPPGVSKAVMDERGDGVVLRVWARPGAKRDAILGSKADEKDQHWLQLSIKTVPEDGKANAAIIAFLAQVLGIKRSQIQQLQGQTSPRKLFLISHLS